ncbi:hypothetical protein BDZ85DRAFT_255647 [Elsinoe ampelina]|uniref:Potassium channel domain-containing protein n=1 Tax=Elsinoe ampelina TaxID=302913 RepID=A0A6A6GR72_9PEZI|nr:hypothetical protein BDZ85DRAFT_255647 [Elsinoe ampelina]
MWYLATGILIAITVSMEIHVPPIRPQQTYSQGFWYAILAAVMYLIASMLLMVNMLGYFLGHYPQEFELTESQRTLILQTMLFFIWLASGGAIFAKVEQTYGDGNTNWSYVNSLYFSDVTILTVGFGDLSATSSAGRGLVFPYSVGGTIMLGLVISSISRFATELGSEKVVDKRRERTRIRTVDRVVSSPEELHRLRGNVQSPRIGSISGPSDPVNNSARLRISEPQNLNKTSSNASALTFLPKPIRPNQKPRPLLLRDEKDRFKTMRRIQLKTRKYKQWTGLMLSIFSFCVLWLLGALVFFYAESQTQGLTYFEALYFCYVSLLTIGYGDLAPKSNIGRPFFVLWSLIAVPTMTILISAMGDTVIQGFKKGVEKGAEVTILPRRGVIGDILKKSGIIGWIEDRKARKELDERRERGFDVGPDEEQTVKTEEAANETVDPAEDTTTAGEDDREPSEFELATRLALAIQQVAMDLQESPPKRYEYDEWLEFTTLIKFTNYGSDRAKDDNSEEEGLIEWDWIGEDSPMMAKQSEPEFVLDRLCESMSRYIKRQASGHRKEEKDTGAGLIEAGGAIVEEDEDVTSMRRVATSGEDTQSDTDTAVPPS